VVDEVFLVRKMYTTPQEIRDLLGVTIEDAPDDILEEFIDKAQHVVIKYWQVQIKDETMTGSINGSNNTFSVSNKFIADTDFDKKITTNDFTIYLWTDEDDPGSRVEATVSTFYPEHGKFVLSSAPSTDVEKITIDYSYYTKAIDWDLVNLATAYYAGMLWVAREQYLVPETFAIGGIRVRSVQPWERLREEFFRIVNQITSVPMDYVRYRKMVLAPRIKGRFRGPGTVVDYEESRGRKRYVKDTT